MYACSQSAPCVCANQLGSDQRNEGQGGPSSRWGPVGFQLELISDVVHVVYSFIMYVPFGTLTLKARMASPFEAEGHPLSQGRVEFGRLEG